MSDFNQAIVLGNITRDPEVRNTATGQTVASFSVATNRRWTDKNGEKQESAEFHNIVTWGKLAEIAGQLLYKGRKVLIVGRIQTRSWEGQDGIKRYTTEIVANELSALGAPRGTEGSTNYGATGGITPYDPQANQSKNQTTAGEESQVTPLDEPTTKTATKNTPKTGEDNKDEINLDDIPF